MSNDDGGRLAILAVEDDEDQLEQLKERLGEERFGGDQLPAAVTAVSSFDEAYAPLATQAFDVVVLDVRADRGGIDDDDAGIRLLDVLRETTFAPVVLYTGQPLRVDDKRSALVRVVEKTAGLDAVVAAVNELVDGPATVSARRLRGELDGIIRDFMWSYVETHWEEVQTGTGAARALHRRLALHFDANAARLAEFLGDGTSAGKAHPTQYYVVPPLREEELPHRVGEIHLIGDEWRLLLTPTCDFARGNAEHATFAAAVPLEQSGEFTRYKRSQNRENTERLSRLMGNRGGERWHFLPAAYGVVPNLLIDFQRTFCIPVADLRDDTCVATVDSPFVEAIVARYGRYLSRLGTPDLDTELVLGSLDLS